MTVPGYFSRCCSSHCTDSASKWLVGSSSNSKSGCCNSNLHNATRRRSPPESTDTSASDGGQRNASIACSSWLSRSHALRWSILSCSVPISAIKESKSASGSAISAETSLNRASMALVSATPSSTFSKTFLVSSRSGSWASMPTVKPGLRNASPLDTLSIPAMILSRLDLPAPLGPTTPILAPGRNDSVTSSKMTLSPWALRALERV